MSYIPNNIICIMSANSCPRIPHIRMQLDNVNPFIVLPPCCLYSNKDLWRFDDEKKNIYYSQQEDKRRNYNNPEEQVQVEAYLKLIFSYGYPSNRIKLFVSIAMGVSTKEADIVVYNDDEY